jgi:hypothetical protein
MLASYVKNIILAWLSNNLLDQESYFYMTLIEEQTKQEGLMPSSSLK